MKNSGQGLTEREYFKREGIRRQSQKMTHTATENSRQKEKW
jgi:hypothetical protein